MKYLTILILFLLIAFQAHSQSTSTKEPRVKTLTNAKGDTVLLFHLDDAKVILTDILDKEVIDSLLSIFTRRNELSKKTIELQLSEIKELVKKDDNQEIRIKNLESIVNNKDAEITDKDDIINQQKKDIRRLKFQKTLAIIAAVALPILVVVVTSP